MFIDDVTITIKAGDGGDGAVAFQKVKNVFGPTGTSGGVGGSIYAEGVSDLGALISFRYKKTVNAKDGANGRSQFRDGADGKDEIIKVPVGTVLHNLDTGTEREVIKIGEKILIASGGRGGRGNFHFRSSTNTTPKQAEKGKQGQKFTLRLELKLIADVGLIGFPNAGKSSLLNELTSAKAKVANYPFTTLEPNLGVFYDLILADIPGIIEGASQGKGLGIKFLRHIERTKVFFHLISAESEDVEGDYRTTRRELERYNPELLKKTEYLFLSKADTISPLLAKKKLAILKKSNKKTQPLSIVDDESLERVRKILHTIENEKQA